MIFWLKKLEWSEFSKYPKQHQRKCVRLLNSLKSFNKKQLVSLDKFGKLARITLRYSLKSAVSNHQFNQLSHKHLLR